jgi:hypothetical protein
MLLQFHPLIEIAVWVAFVLGGMICVMNFSLPVRYYYRRWKKFPRDSFVSPIPILGSLFVFLALRVLDVIPAAKMIGMVLIAIDVGGIHWMMLGIAVQLCRQMWKGKA